MRIKAKQGASLKVKNKIREHPVPCLIKSPPECVPSADEVLVVFEDGYVRWFPKDEVEFEDS